MPLGTIEVPCSGEVRHQPGDRVLSFKRKEALKVKKVNSLGPYTPHLMELVWKAVKPHRDLLRTWVKDLEFFSSQPQLAVPSLFPGHGLSVTS